MASSSNAQKSKELVWLVAAILSLSLFAFIGGYMLGMRHGARAFLCAQQEEIAAATADDTTVQESNGQAVSETIVKAAGEAVPAGAPVAATSYWAVGAIVDSYAQATQLMEQAARVNVVMRIKKAVNLLPYGKKKIIYQLVTPRYATKEQLDQALARLKAVPGWVKYINVITHKD